jgi:hypothetical protein
VSGEFSKKVEAWQRKVERRIVQVVQRLILEITYELVDLSPWGDWDAWSERWQKRKPRPPYEPGLFKGSWDYGRGAASQMAWDTIDAEGQSSIDRVKAQVSTMTLKTAATRHFITNKTPYARAMEGGWKLVGHNLELGHMVETTAQNFPSIVIRAVSFGG